MDVNQTILQQYKLYQKYQQPPPTTINQNIEVKESQLLFNPVISNDLEIYLYQTKLQAILLQKEQNDFNTDIHQIAEKDNQSDEESSYSSFSSTDEFPQQQDLQALLTQDTGKWKCILDRQSLNYQDIIDLYDMFKTRQIIEKDTLKTHIRLFLQTIEKLIQFGVAQKLFLEIDRAYCINEMDNIIFE